MVATSTSFSTTVNAAPTTLLSTEQINHMQNQNHATLEEPNIPSPKSSLTDPPSTTTVSVLHNSKINI